MAPFAPLCFVLMPFGRKPDGVGGFVDFDAVYQDAIKPAISDAGLEPIRADEEIVGGIIHKPMFERLVLCQYAIADLTTANANVFYELGIRHAVRSWSTVLMFADTARLPFDVGPLRALPYRLGADGRLADAKGLRAALTTQLQNAQVASQVNPTVDSPLFQLLDGYPNIAHERTDIFRETVEYSRQAKDKLAFARSIDLDAVRKAEGELGPLKNLEAGVVIDLFLSYRSQRGWSDMIRMAGEMPRELAETILVQEQLGLALNREGRHDEAERIILALVDRRGPSSETFGILGRIYKDQWEKIRYGSSGILARGMLDKAIGAYLRGFEADWRDAYPGINAVTLMEVRDPPDPRRVKLTPIVRYAVERKIASGKADYWDHATLLELAVLAKDDASAASTAGDALAAVREKWEPETTARNLRLIREGRAQRNESVPWADEIEAELNRRSAT